VRFAALIGTLRYRQGRRFERTTIAETQSGRV
jgi:hypothetical protein